MSNYPSQTLQPIYPHPIVRQYSLQPYYYSYNKYPSSPLLLHMSYTTTPPRDQYSSSLKYLDDEEIDFPEYHRRHHYSHHSNHRQYSNHPKANRARNISR